MLINKEKFTEAVNDYFGSEEEMAKALGNRYDSVSSFIGFMQEIDYTVSAYLEESIVSFDKVETDDDIYITASFGIKGKDDKYLLVTFDFNVETYIETIDDFITMLEEYNTRALEQYNFLTK